MKEKWSKHQCHEMLTFYQWDIKRTSVQFSITSEVSTTSNGVCSTSKMCCLFQRGQTWGSGGGLSFWHTGDVLPRELLATSSSYVENCLGNSYKKEEELKKLNSPDFASGLQQLGQWMQPSSWLQLAQSCAGRSCSRLSLGASELQLLKIAAPHVCCMFGWVFPCPVYFCDTRNQGNNNFRKNSVLQNRMVEEKLVGGKSHVV